MEAVASDAAIDEPPYGGKRVCRGKVFAREDDEKKKDDDYDGSSSDDSSSSSSSSDDENEDDITDVVLGVGCFVGRDDDGTSSKKKEKGKKKKKSTPAHVRRLRTAALSTKGKKKSKASKKRSAPRADAEEEDCDDKEEDCKRQRCHISEPQTVREADAKMMDPHPAVIYVREHTPIRPCGRCKECRKPPCGQCSNCRNNEHLAERSHDRKRCISLGCGRLSLEEIERYRVGQNSLDALCKIQRDIRDMRTRIMNEHTSADAVAALKAEHEAMMRRMQVLSQSDSVRAIDDDAPEGYGCLLLSLQTLETERDRIARLIERRTTRDSPEVMHTRRQLRNFYALQICSMVEMFAEDTVAQRYVEGLRKTSRDYEELVRSLPIS